MKKYSMYAVIFYFFIISNAAHAQSWPQGLSLVGLKNENWQLFVVAKGQSNLLDISTVSEPRTPAFHLETGKVAYIAADGSLREYGIDKASNKVLLKAGRKHAYTQPAYDPVGKNLFVVELKEGTSVDTDILMLDRTKKNRKPIVIQRSAQFEPFMPTKNELYYSNVLCTVGCGKIIQEIWHMNIVSGEAKQLTMVNSIARQPFVPPGSDWLYFSSNKEGHYHIWRMNMTNNKYEQLTQGYVTDISPVMDKNNNLYFIRRSPQAVQLMHMDAKGELKPMTLPKGVTDIRDLEMNY